MYVFHCGSPQKRKFDTVSLITITAAVTDAPMIDQNACATEVYARHEYTTPSWLWTFLRRNQMTGSFSYFPICGTLSGRMSWLPRAVKA